MNIQYAKGIFTLGLITATLTASAATVLELKFNPAKNGPDASLNRKPDTKSGTELMFSWDATKPLFNGDKSVGQKLYGGFAVMGETGGVGAPDCRIQDAGGEADFMMLSATKSGDHLFLAKGLVLWDRADFKDAADTFDKSSECVLNLTVATFNNSKPEGIRFVIRDGNTYYVSSLSQIGHGNFAVSGDAPGLRWAAFDAKGFAGFSNRAPDLGVGAEGFSEQIFSNVTGVGFIFDMKRPGSHPPVLRIGGFSVSLVP